MIYYEIFDAQNSALSLLGDWPIFQANRPIDAARKYLESIGEHTRPTVSGDRHVRLVLTPITYENGRKYILSYKRRMGFKVI